jgi:hypothetical protein
MKAARKKRPRPEAVLLEALEDRVLLSGVITTSLIGGNLTIAGDADPNKITITKASNEVIITANDGETFAGLMDDITGVTGNITINMNAGNDVVTIGASTFRVGNDTPVAPFGKPQNPKNLTVNMGAGDDDLTLIAVTAQNVSIAGGTGDNITAIRDNGDGDPLADATRILGNLTVTNNTTGSETVLRGVQIAKNATIGIGNGGGYVEVSHDTDESYGSFIGGALTINGGSGADTVTLGDDAFGSGLATVVQGNTVLNLGAAPGGYLNEVNLDNAVLYRDLKVNGGSGEDRVYVRDPGLEVVRNASFLLGNGFNKLKVEGNSIEVGGNLTYTGGSGEDRIRGGSYHVGGNATFTLGGGVNDVEIGEADFIIGGNFALTAGSGSDEVDFGEISLSVIGTATINLGGGENSTNFVYFDGGGWNGMGPLPNFGRDFTYTGGSGPDELEWRVGSLVVNGNLVANMGAGENEFDLGSDYRSEIHGKLQYTGGSGDDYVEFEASGDFAPLLASEEENGDSHAEVVIDGDLLLNLGAGCNYVDIEDLLLLQVGRNLTYTGNSGADTWDSNDGEDNETQIIILGNATFNPGNGPNNFDLAPEDGNVLVSGALTYQGGAGDDEIDLNNHLNMASGLFNLGNGSNLLDLDEVFCIGNLRITGGIGEDTISLDEMFVGGDLFVDLKPGPNFLEIDDMDVAGDFTYLGGPGHDVDLDDTSVIGNTLIVFTVGDNTLDIWDDCFFGGTFTLLGSVGADDVYIGPESAMFIGQVVISLGLGADTLQIQHGVFTDPSVFLDGGVGAGDELTIDVAASQFDYTPVIVGWETQTYTV